MVYNADGDLEVKEYVGKIKLTGCTNGLTYKIYRSDDFYTNPNDIKSNGAYYNSYKCENNKIEFYVETFSSYTAQQAATLNGKVSSYYSFDNNQTNDSINNFNAVNFGATYIDNGSQIVGNGSFFYDRVDDYMEINSIRTLKRCSIHCPPIS